MRRRRYIVGNSLYEMCIRTKEGLPFPAWSLMNLLLKSAIARTQRDTKVDIVAKTWMANHLHILFVTTDAMQCLMFHMELKKKVTEMMKRLRGKETLILWEETSLMHIVDVRKAVERLVYLFANPAAAGLVNSIEEYPGVTSWKVFKEGKITREEVPYIRMPAIEPLKRLTLGRGEDDRLTRELTESAKGTHTLTINPTAWLDALKVTDPVKRTRLMQMVVSFLELREAKLKEKRLRTKRPIMGAERLRNQGIIDDHKSRKKERKVFVLASSKWDRINYIEFMDSLELQCRELYKLMRQGHTGLDWPPGVFIPSCPPTYSAFPAVN